MSAFGTVTRAGCSGNCTNSPMGIFARSPVHAAANEDRFTAAHASHPVVVGNKVLTAKARAHIKPANFALPGGRYPINDPAHGRAALSRVSQFGTPEEKAKVRAKVHAKFPGIGG